MYLKLITNSILSIKVICLVQGEAGRAQVDRSYPENQPDCNQPGLLSSASEPLATSHTDKASVLAYCFFPYSTADLSNINLDLQDYSYQWFPIDQTVKEAEITTILCETRAWKALGPDLLPTGFLKVCKGLLAKLLAQIAIVYLQLRALPDPVLCREGSSTLQAREDYCIAIDSRCILANITP